ncbi:uncharacterized protein LOC110984295 [Acanthaster planci]|uniref:Uncharacterized protein LOC110984295 n=1 Tax=Acanthaster planci TaxID=133434 RepID=A0A8B7Z5E3_ACAPL|nr:uncharacterized protein LOC110984295 [Acanthaster planci]
MDSKVVCKCPKCGPGKFVSERTFNQHGKEWRAKRNDEHRDDPRNFDPKNAPLFTGSEVSVLQAVTMLLSVHGLFPGVSQRAIGEIFRILHYFILPAGNGLPDSFVAAKKLVGEFLIPVNTFDVCPQDHVVFDGPNRERLHCPKCSAPRYHDGTQKPQKAFAYLPLIPRLQRWFKMPVIARSLQQHELIEEQNPVKDIHMSPAWKSMYNKDGVFGGDSRCLSLALSADGFDPFNHQKVQYSMCPVLLKCLNFDSTSRDKIGKMLLSCIVPGPCGPTDINPYMAPLIDELQELEEGVRCFDGSKDASFILRARVVMGIFDNPGASKVLKTAAPGSLINACRHCHIEGKHIKEYGKVIHGENRRYLPPESPLRTNSFGNYESRPPHELTSMGQQLDFGRQVLELWHKASHDPTPHQRKKAKSAATKLEKATGKKGVEELARLPYYTDVDIPVELMHTVQVVMKKFFGLLTGRDDNEKLHDAEAALGRKINMRAGNSAPWTLTKEEKKTADERLLQIRPPCGLDWTPKKLFTRTSLPYMKCSDWKKLASNGILKYALRGALGDAQRTTLSRLCDTIRELTDYSVDLNRIGAIEKELHEVLSLVEQDFPLGIQTLCMHILHHASSTLRKYGPATSQWMFGFERFMSFLSGRILNRKEPEATAIEAYRIYEFSQFMAMSGLLPEGSVCTKNSITVIAANESPDNQLESHDNPKDQRDVVRRQREALLEENKAALLSLGISGTSVEKVFTAQKANPRTLKYSCLEKDTSKSTVSSIIAGFFQAGGGSSNRWGTQYVYFGQVLYFLRCKDTLKEFGKISWWKQAIIDTESGLWKIEEPQEHLSTDVVPVALLSPPLTTAMDEHGVLWVLDFNSKYVNVIR